MDNFQSDTVSVNKLYIVDTFTAKPYSGNPAPVVIVESFPENMQDIAAELGFSSTAFVSILANASPQIRWFSPKQELSFCGHALLAAGHVLHENGVGKPGAIKLESLSANFDVVKDGDRYVLDLALGEIGEAVNKAVFQELFGILGIKEVYRSQGDIIVVLQSERDLGNLTLDFAKIEKIQATAVIVTAPSNSYDFISRVFAPRVGINEDAVTGSSHCKLAAYWSKTLDRNILNAYQASARGGLVEVEVVGERALIKGKAVTTVKGELCI